VRKEIGFKILRNGLNISVEKNKRQSILLYAYTACIKERTEVHHAVDPSSKDVWHTMWHDSRLMALQCHLYIWYVLIACCFLYSKAKTDHNKTKHAAVTVIINRRNIHDEKLATKCMLFVHFVFTILPFKNFSCFNNF